MGVILDTSVLIAAEHGRFALGDMLASAPDERYFMAAISVSELLLGAHLLREPASHARKLAAIEMTLSRIPTLPFGTVEARSHAGLMAMLRRAGSLIGPHDLIIAATAIAGGHALATLDTSDFSRVPGLRLVDIAPYGYMPG
jgi:predicted nucleic acid-binding protein